jgi:tRNA (guanine-N(7)-)-methyltransferase subunit TRM82
MPKRICAIVFTPDEQSILAGDKFGDVYLLPLEPDPDWTPAKTDISPETAWAPSATELTVHTKGNLEALKQQRKLKMQQPRKEGIQFQLKLLLGHVSLLTDVAIIEAPVDLKGRQYILTADRDEHIRVSRGITQAHIIENYCLGHREFVSKLCIVPWDVEILVAGSGEPALKVYHWRTGNLLDSENFEGAVRHDIMGCSDPDDNERSIENLAVSNIWPVHYTVAGNAPRSSQAPRLLLVAIEG